jgi:uncharacterized membrane protein YraQ (UPF0718 family)
MPTDVRHPTDPHGAARRPAAPPVLPVLILMAGAWALPAGPDDKTRCTLAIVFLSIVLEALPFMLLGSLTGGLIEAFVSRERMASLLPRRRWQAVLLAAAAGLVFPVCECAVVPVVRRLIGKGLPLSAAVAYLLGGPVVNPVVALSTAMAYGFDWRVTGLRLAAGYAIAVFIGLLMGRLFTADRALCPEAHPQSAGRPACGCCGRRPAAVNIHPLADRGPALQESTAALHCACGRPYPPAGRSWADKTGAAFVHAAHDFMAVGHYLFIGAFIAAVAQTFVERSSFLALDSVPALAVAAMMALAVLLNLCSEADAFIAASFRGMMPLSAQLAFMLTGPMFDLKLLLMYHGLFRQRAIIALAAMVLLAVAGTSLCLDWILGGL